MSKIYNIVFYNTKDSKKAAIIYNNGKIDYVDCEKGLDACEELLKSHNITSKKAFTELLNKKYIYTTTEKELVENISKYTPSLEEVALNNFMVSNSQRDIPEPDDVMDEEEKAQREEKFVFIPEYKEDEDKEPLFCEVTKEVNDEEKDEFYEEFDDGFEELPGIEINEIEPEEKEEVVEEKIIKRIQKVSPTTKITSICLSAVIALGILTCCSKKTSEGEITDNTTVTTPTTVTTTTEETTTVTAVQDTTDQTVVYNNDLYNDLTYSELLDVTQSQVQANTMTNAYAQLLLFNGTFADAYIETGNDIRAALSFEEMMALQQAYNEYSTDDVRAIFNGNEVNAITMSNDYKSASLQLMGAYIIESSENPVDMTFIINSEEGREFYNRYHSMFLAAKEATGEEQLELVRQFFEAVRNDFPITEEVRTEGISHSEDHNSLNDYQLAVTPMIAAAEMIFQNLDIDYTLADSEIDFINDIGLCNYADDKFERIETITLAAYEDNENPLYIQYRNAIVNELTEQDKYVIDDDHRELSNLLSFQMIVNGENYYLGTNSEYVVSGGTPSSSTTTSTSSWDETETSTTEETEVIEEPIPEDEQRRIDEETNNENAEAQARAEEEAADEARRQQEEENNNANRVEEEIAAADEELQNDIDDANTTINNNNSDNNISNDRPVNESDFSSNVDFDDDHSDSNGNLDNSVQNITTDSTGYVEDAPLPNPNDTEAEFEVRTTERYYTNTAPVEVYEEETTSGYIEFTDSDFDAFVEFTEEYTTYDEYGNPIKSTSKQNLVDKFVESLVTNETETTKVLTK